MLGDNIVHNRQEFVIQKIKCYYLCMQASGATGAPPQPPPPQDSTPPTTMLPVPTFNPNPMVQIVRPTGGVLKRPLEQVTCFKVSTHSYFNFINCFL